MKEIARIAQVSQQAVSSALGGSARCHVSEETRHRILDIAQKLHYVPNTTSRILKGGRSRLIGFFSSDSYFGIAPDIIREFSGQMQQSGYKLLSSGGFRNKTPEESRRAVLEMESIGVEGIAVLDEGASIPAEFFHVPHILMRTKKFSDVNIDLYCGGKIAAEHLVSHGRKRIAYLASYPAAGHFRVQAWREVLEKNGIFDPELHLNVRQFGGDDAALLRELLRLKVDGVIAHNDQIAAKLIVLMQHSGLRVPEDAAVIGCDGHSFCDVCLVPLSTMVLPARQLALRAAELFKERLEKHILNAPPAGLLLKPVLRPSVSCGCTAHTADPLNPVNTYRLLDSHDGFNIGNRK